MADQALHGGFSEPRATTQIDQMIIEQIRHEVSLKLQQPFAWIQGIRVSAQIVSGTNYLFEVLSHEREYLHLKVFVPLPKDGFPQKPKLEGVKRHQQQNDPLVPF